MPSAVEQALTIIVPEYNVLPPELVNLATALLSQSHAKASSLKPDEEVARAYVCAQIACERLKSRLSLEKLESRPPVRPQIYKKLYIYLERLLKSATTPSTRRPTDRLASSGQSTPRSTRATPTPRATRSARGTPNTATRHGTEATTPSRRSSKRATPPTANHTGVDGSLVKRQKLAANDAANDDEDAVVPGLEHDDVLGDILHTAGTMNPPTNAPQAKAPSKTPLRRKEKHAARPGSVDNQEKDGLEGPAGLRVGLGTMFQDAFDWLSEDRTEAYQQWSRDILHRLDVQERQQRG